MTVTKRNVTINGGGMTGGMITSPQTLNVGEDHGYREALIPRDLPLNRINPSVREMAALLRGEGSGSGRSAAGGIGKQVNVGPINVVAREADQGGRRRQDH